MAIYLVIWVVVGIIVLVFETLKLLTEIVEETLARHKDEAGCLWITLVFQTGII